VGFESEYPPFYVTVDIVVLTIHDGALHALAIRRGGEPFRGVRALPGGFVGIEEDLRDAARRELEEETGFRVHDDALEQIGAYGAPDRDPRYRVVSVAWLAAVPEASAVRGGTDASNASWEPVDALLAEELAFDHADILRRAVDRARELVLNPVEDRRPLAASLLAEEEVSLSQLRAVHEAVLGRALDPGNFQRKVKSTQQIVEPTGRRESSASGRGRPAELFRLTPPRASA
jgi:8-oxo-dGTP diphosphatase